MIYQKLIEIQNELKAPKSRFNSFGKYNYRSAEDILEAAKQVNKKHGCTLIVSDKVELIGNRFYVKATATLYDIENGENTSVTAYAREDETKRGMDGSQITGTASSYARKYALNGLYNIDDTKDADTDEYQRQNAQQAPRYTPEKINQTQISTLRDLMNQAGVEESKILATYKLRDIEDMTTDTYGKCLRKLNATINKEGNNV